MPNAGTGDSRVLNLSPLCACREIAISRPRNTVIFDFILVLRERWPKESAKGYTLSKKSCRAMECSPSVLAATRLRTDASNELGEPIQLKSRNTAWFDSSHESVRSGRFMRRGQYALVVFLVVLIAGCSGVRGSGKIVTESRNVSGFTSI